MAQEFGFGSVAADPLAGMIGSMEQMRRMWAGIGVPGSLAPTIDPKELERRITDLRVIEQWLEANLGMLRSTIQALEMQHGALAALHSISESLASAIPGEPAVTAEAARASRPEAEQDREPGPAQQSAAPEQAGLAVGADTAGAPDKEPAAPATASVPAGPAGWWELLQRQFNEIARTALGAAGPGGGSPTEGRAATTAAAATAEKARRAPAKNARRAPAAKAKSPRKAASKPGPAATSATAGDAKAANRAARSGTAPGPNTSGQPAPDQPTPATGSTRSKRSRK